MNDPFELEYSLTIESALLRENTHIFFWQTFFMLINFNNITRNFS